MALPRRCEMCNKRFQPNTRQCKLCETCRQLVRHVNFINMISHRIKRPKVEIYNMKNKKKIYYKITMKGG
jgi:hypothetical protein